ncbi:MAG: hypothetical protein WKI04_04405 [Ferruginibacter sp.]
MLKAKIKTSTPAKQVVLATALWNTYEDDNGFELVHQHLLQHRAECLNVVFLCLVDFKDNDQAKAFLVTCLEGGYDELFLKANTTIGLWA